MSLFAKISSYDERSARLAGIGLMLLSIFMFSFGDALGKFMVATYSVGQLLWLRACAALLVLLPMIWKQRAEFKRLERPWLQLLRVTLSTLEVAAFFLATVYLPLADVITYYLACPIFVTLLSPIGWVTPSLGSLGLFAAAGCISVAALLCVNRSLKLAPASVVVPYQYSMIVWAVMFGYVVFGDVPQVATLAGAAIIIGAGLYIFLRERDLGRGETVVSQ